MSEFSSYLKEYIALHNINVSTMVKYCNMDRGTMYKYINGKLLPPSLELIQRMAEYMQLSPAEQGIFFENYHISKVGRYTYLRRKKAEQFLTEFPDSTVHLSMKNMSAIPAAPSASVTAPDGYVSCLALNSSSALNGQVCQILQNEMGTKNPCLALFLQPEYSFIMQYMAAHIETYKSMEITHIFCLDQVHSVQSGHTFENMDYLKKILPLYFGSLNYRPYYYYENIRSHFNSFNFFPCLILTTHEAVTCTSDFSQGIYYSEPSVVQLFWNFFNYYKSKCAPLLSPAASILAECHTLIPMISNIRSYSIQGEPCVVPVFPENLLEKYVLKNIEHRDELIQAISLYLRSSNETLYKYKCQIYCTLDGLRTFLETGFLDELPAEIRQPFDMADRLTLVKQIYKAAQAGCYYLLNDVLSKVPVTLHMSINPHGGYFLLKNNQGQTIYLLIQEPWLIETFYDYVSELPPTHTYTIEDSCRMIWDLIREFSDRNSSVIRDSAD